MNLFGGGGQAATTRVLAGQVVVTTGNAVVTKAGGAFLTEFKRGQCIRIADQAAATSFKNYTIASVDSDTQITMTTGYTPAGAAAASRDYDGLDPQYSPPMINLEGPMSHHGTGDTAGDFMYGIYASGGGGQLHVMRSAARGVSVTPTADHIGNGLVTTRRVDNATYTVTNSTTETNMVTGYTTPAYELTNGTVFRIKFTGTLDANATTTTVIWRVKLGGTTILTSPTHEIGTAAAGTFSGEIHIVGTGDQAQRVSLHVAGKDNAVLTGGDTFSYRAYGTSAIDMRLDRTITVTAQFGDALSTISTTFSTVEIL
jgi:hypothetical protein